MIHLHRSLVAPFKRHSPMYLVSAGHRWHSVRTTASGWVSANTWSFTPSLLPHCFMGSPFEMQFRGSCLIHPLDRFSRWLQRSDVWQLAQLSTSIPNCTTQDSKRVFLITSNGAAGVFPHILTCVRTLRHVFPHPCSKLRMPRRQSAIQICGWLVAGHRIRSPVRTRIIQLHLSPALFCATASVVPRQVPSLDARTDGFT